MLKTLLISLALVAVAFALAFGGGRSMADGGIRMGEGPTGMSEGGIYLGGGPARTAGFSDGGL